MATTTVHKESDGLSTTQTLSYTIRGDLPVFVNGWFGIPAKSGDSGDSVALAVEKCEYQFKVPIAVANGDVVYITVVLVTEHEIPDAAYGTSSGAGKLALFKATGDQDANDYVNGIFLGGLHL